MRNLINKNYGAKTEIRSGFTQRVVEYKEGDVWEEKGKKWTIKNGIRRSVTKSSLGRQIIRVPYKCPKCYKSLSHQAHKKMYRRWKMCLTCVSVWMEDMRKNNTYDDFMEHFKTSNFNAAINDIIKEYDDWLDKRNSIKYITEAGDKEQWSGGKTNEELKADFDKTINTIKEKFEKAHESNKIKTDN